MKILKAIDIASGFVEMAAGFDENDLTNLKLQKLLYFAQGTYLASKGVDLFSDEIEAWDLGPVVREVYNTFKVCGAFPITAFDIKYKATELPPDVSKFVQEIWEKYSIYSASHLVDLTHESTPWLKAYRAPHKVISKDEMASYFSK